MSVTVKVTDWVTIETLNGGDEKRYWFTPPDGVAPEEGFQEANKIMQDDIRELGRDPKHYDYIFGDNGEMLTLLAVYNHKRASGNEQPMNELERYRNWKEVDKIIKRRA